MDVSLKPTAASFTLLLHAAVLTLLLSAAPERVFASPCPGCGGFNSFKIDRRPRGPEYPGRLPLPSLTLAPEKACPKNRKVGREPELEEGGRLPHVDIAPVAVCVRVGSDGHVLALSFPDDPRVSVREPSAVEAVRALRFRPATSAGRPVPFWLRATLRTDPRLLYLM
jgi:hypothetical protein